MPTKQEVLDLEVANLADNTNGGITPADVRQVLEAAVEFADQHVPTIVPLNTIVKVDVTNTHDGLGIADRQIQFGVTADISDAGFNYSRGSTVSIAQRVNSSGVNPMFLTLSSPDTGSANGMLFYGYGANGKMRPALMTRSNYGESNPDDTGFAMTNQMAEKPGVETTVCLIRALNFYNADPTNFAAGKAGFYASGTRTFFAEPLTWILRVDNYSKAKIFGVRASGDVHFAGSVYNNTLFPAADFSLSLDKYRYKYTGGAANCALPNPAGDNAGRSHKIQNHGTGVLTFTGYPIYLDATTTKTSLNYVAPDNLICIYSDGTNWIAE